MSPIKDLPPGKYVWEICCNCGGDGKHSKHLGSFSMSELAEDPDFAEDYFAGGYDRPCEECGGSGKVKAVRPGALSFGELRALVKAEREPKGPWWLNDPDARAERAFGA